MFQFIFYICLDFEDSQHSKKKTIITVVDCGYLSIYLNVSQRFNKSTDDIRITAVRIYQYIKELRI